MTTHKHWTHVEPSPVSPSDVKRDAAVRTLERLGYTHRGGVEWAPPLGPAPVFPEDIDAAAGGYPTEPVGAESPRGVPMPSLARMVLMGAEKRAVARDASTRARLATAMQYMEEKAAREFAAAPVPRPYVAGMTRPPGVYYPDELARWVRGATDAELSAFDTAAHQCLPSEAYVLHMAARERK